MIISPEIIVTPDYPVARIREPREKVDLAVELPKILSAQGWGLGTEFRVQFISHDRTKLLAMARFVVTEESEALQTADASPHQTITKAVAARKWARLGPWWEASMPVEGHLEGEEVVAKPKRGTKAA